MQNYTPEIRMRILNGESTERINSGALRVLEETGIQLLSDEARRLLARSGCKLHDSNIVTIPSKLVDKSLKSAPKSAVLYDRFGNEKCRLEGWNTYYGTGSDCPFICDRETGNRRTCTYQDLVDGTRVVDYLENFDFIMPIGIISDRPTHTADVYAVEATLRHTAKPIVFTAHNKKTLEDSIRLASLVAGGMKKLQEKPTIGVYIEQISPLLVTNEVADKLILSAQLNIPVVFTPCPSMGATAPGTKAGTLVQSTAECLGGLVLHQLLNPGAPIIFGGVINALDMKTTIYPYGSPELRLLCAAMTDMAHFYGLPMFGTAGCSDSKTIDSQAGSEGGISLLMSTLSGQNLIHDVGYIDSGLVVSYDYFVLSNELIGQAKFIAKGIKVNGYTTAESEIAAIAHKGNYLESPFTSENLREEFYFPKLAERSNYSNWEKNGRLGQDKVISENVDCILGTHTPESLPKSVVEQMQKVLQDLGGE